MDTITEVKEKLDEHAIRLEQLEKNFIKSESRIDNLCEKISNLTNSIDKWVSMLTTASITGIIAIIVFVIERQI